MKCGYLNSDQSGNVSGEYHSWNMPALKIALRKSPEAGKAPGLPSHEVIAKNPHGAWMQIGVAWENKIKQGEKAGWNCYSIQLEHPEVFQHPVKLSAFPTTDAATFGLEFDRSKKPGDVEQGQSQQAA